MLDVITLRISAINADVICGVHLGTRAGEFSTNMDTIQEEMLSTPPFHSKVPPCLHVMALAGSASRI